MKEVLSNKKIMGIGLVVIALIVLVFVLVFNGSDNISDGEKFSLEYTQVGLDNVFVYRSSDEIIDILEHGTGVILFGFPSCPWCQRYVVYLNEVAKELDYEKIYYYNIFEDRKNNTDTYKRIVEILGDNLQYDEEGKRRIFVPLVVGVSEGEIMGCDDETSVITEDIEPDDYWTLDKINNLKDKLRDILNSSNPNMCSSCNE